MRRRSFVEVSELSIGHLPEEAFRSLIYNVGKDDALEFGELGLRPIMLADNHELERIKCFSGAASVVPARQSTLRNESRVAYGLSPAALVGAPTSDSPMRCEGDR